MGLNSHEFSYQMLATSVAEFVRIPAIDLGSVAMSNGRKQSYLRRLPCEYYRGRACVHWSMTMEGRRSGWLMPALYYKFRELLTHTAFRYGLTCPIYCCMPDHIHLLWIGFVPESDQRNAARFLRRQLNIPLSRLGYKLQGQAYDHVLREGEQQVQAFEALGEYIARNPERAGLVRVDGYQEYKYTGCLVPGYPDLSPWQKDYWSLFWRLYSRLSHGRLGEDEGLLE